MKSRVKSSAYGKGKKTAGGKWVGRNQRFGTPEKLKALGTPVSLCQLARATGLTVAHMSRIFNQKRIPSLTTAAKIAAYLGVSIDRLYVVLCTGTGPRVRPRGIRTVPDGTPDAPRVDAGGRPVGAEDGSGGDGPDTGA